MYNFNIEGVSWMGIAIGVRQNCYFNCINSAKAKTSKEDKIITFSPGQV